MCLCVSCGKNTQSEARHTCCMTPVNCDARRKVCLQRWLPPVAAGGTPASALGWTTAKSILLDTHCFWHVNTEMLKRCAVCNCNVSQSQTFEFNW
jgi:hypothetical protein